MHAIVVGAGVAGLTTAYLLQQEGLRVSIVDRATGPAQGASRGNGAQLSYSYVAPLADPSVLTKLPSLLFSPDSPLKIRPQLDPAQWRWALAFLKSCNAAQARRTTAALLSLSALSRHVFDALIAQENIACSFTRSGKLVLLPDAASLQAAQRQLEFQATLGCRQQMLTPQECTQHEPALAAYLPHIAGGVWTPDEAAADSAQFCEGLAALLQQRGARFHSSCEVQDIATDKGGVRIRMHNADAGSRTLDADALVLAAGSHAAALGRKAGLRLPIYPLKGYSITLDVPPGRSALACSITDTRRKVVFAPLGRTVRVAGFVEIGGHDASIPPARIQALQQAAHEVLGLESGTAPQGWCGFRPATPTGLPLLGATPRKNLYLNVGQGALGWTLASGSARLVVDAMLGRRSAIDGAPFAYRA
jgi:D-amino-acid dehydrogenase